MSSELRRRKKNRLEGYDYSRNGAYFITMCVKDLQKLLWDVGARIARPDYDYELSLSGRVVEVAIENIHKIYPAVYVDKYVIMSNHIHMILVISNDDDIDGVDGVDGIGGRAMRAPTVSTVINQLKGYVTKQIGHSIWQKLFHDHIIRNEREYEKIWKYIDENPMKWAEDCYYK